METVIRYLLVFCFGGLLCLPAQILICKTKLTPARILTGYVVSGVILGAAGIYGKLIRLFGSGASVPLTGFGASLAEGVREAVDAKGLPGALTGGFSARSAGLCAAILLSVVCAALFNSKRRK